MTVVFINSDNKTSWEKCFIDAKKKFLESCSRKPPIYVSSISIPRNRSGVNVNSIVISLLIKFASQYFCYKFTCASSRLHMSTDQNDVWICSTDGQMSQVCILNTLPEVSVSSCNTVCNSPITCILCAPPHKRNSSFLSARKSSQQHEKATENGSNQPDSSTLNENLIKNYFNSEY
jgi:hypothetical protein